MIHKTRVKRFPSETVIRKMRCFERESRHLSSVAAPLFASSPATRS
jgi:hypothetical protein